ncbi:N-acetylmuramidase domain-containing protein [Salaquimonas pukyongi]|uniref:N-acetylmuramidase domain-containing protein n=1 Tax=Salaquimonas pukyongi TaxID=2712698 RepID=UPI00096B8868|nr:N-acetylmuramidase domain-containing protein [Salaquimonas pukyongi]
MLEAETRTELSRIAKAANHDPAALMAVVDVESGGRVFARVEGRAEPLIRFEGHYFYRLLARQKRNQAVVNGLAHHKAGRVRNPRSQRGRWKLLKRACGLDRDAALQSVSWGVGQVMGAHWRWLDYASIDALVFRARSGLEGQVELMLRFIEKAGLADELVQQNWRAFARGYNGPAYARHGYDRKLENAYSKYRAMCGPALRKDPSKRHQPLLLRFGDRGALVAGLQGQLNRHGFALFVDGDFGSLTRAALKAFQARNGLAADGIAGPKTFIVLERPVLALDGAALPAA